MSEDKAVVLFSGGLDSTVVLDIARKMHDDVYALTFDYGQRNHSEIGSAIKIAALMGVRDHKVVVLPTVLFKGSSLTDDSVHVAKDEECLKRHGHTGTPSSYVPARNTIFLAYALAWAEMLEAQSIYVGFNQGQQEVGVVSPPDTTPEYRAAFERVANLGTKMARENMQININCPIMWVTKRDIVERAMESRLPLHLTVTCYDADENGRACGHCASCQLRIAGFREAGHKDPAPYRK